MLQQLWFPLQLRQHAAKHLIGQQFAPLVQTLELRCQNARPAQIIGCQEFHGRVGVVQPAKGVEARRDLEADVFFSQPGRIDFGQLHHDLQAKALWMAQRLDAALGQGPRVAGQSCNVGDHAQRRQVEMLCFLAGAACASEQRFSQFVSHTYPRQTCQRMVACQPLGIDDGNCRRQHSGQVVVVSDDEIDSATGCIGHGVVGCHACIAGHHQIDALIQEALQSKNCDAMSFVSAHRDVKYDIPAETLEC